ncbi:MAG TPA: hypothetical protein VJ248_08020, partial [Candidatus Udaeobacter sp.]|nr:hypothetical protein [Candidatus Udaeobacter sp.]
FPSPRCASAIQIVRLSESTAETQISDALPFGWLWYDGPDAAKWFQNRLHLRLSTQTLFSFPMPA